LSPPHPCFRAPAFVYRIIDHPHEARQHPSDLNHQHTAPTRRASTLLKIPYRACSNSNRLSLSIVSRYPNRQEDESISRCIPDHCSMRGEPMLPSPHKSLRSSRLSRITFDARNAISRHSDVHKRNFDLRLSDRCVGSSHRFIPEAKEGEGGICNPI
jgi:hypothetical protein